MQTTSLWTPITIAYNWVHQAATLLKNEAQLDGDGVRVCFRGLLGAMAQWKAQVGELAGGIEHFLKVTRSYWPGLFHCYDIQGLPRTNNDLEHIFGQWRHHQRRCTGRCIGITHSGDSWLGAAGCCHCDSTSGSPAQVLCLLFLGLLGSRSALNSKNINNNGFNSDNSDVLPLRIWRLWSRNFSS